MTAAPELTSLSGHIPTPLHDALMRHLEARSDRTLDNILAIGLSLYLLQNESTADSSASYRLAARHYLNATFRRTAA